MNSYLFLEYMVCHSTISEENRVCVLDFLSSLCKKHNFTGEI